MCLYPKLIRNKKYTSNKKNRGVIPPVKDQRTKLVPIGCQNCIECRKQKARAWQVRLLEDIKTHKNGKFITLTFSNKSIKELNAEIDTLEGYERDNQIATLAMRRFLERWRKQYKKSLRHWMVTEIGHQGTENIHLHGIIWTNENLETVEKTWQYGFMWKGKKKQLNKNEYIYENYVNETTIGYITKYVTKIDELHKTYKSKILTSPGIGHNYTNTHDSKKNKFNESKTIETYRTTTGHKISLPIYWRNKIYNEEEREQLWLNKLNQQIRWVRGEKIDISKGEENYYKILKWHQQRNIELGFGNDQKDWSREQYEKERRYLKIKERIIKAEQNERLAGGAVNQKG
ncbi:MAG: replication initiator protein [Microviridae sp.]|nr:MAG: replication initiator protein [Microviridae sp.]